MILLSEIAWKALKRTQRRKIHLFKDSRYRLCTFHSAFQSNKIHFCTIAREMIKFVHNSLLIYSWTMSTLQYQFAFKNITEWEERERETIIKGWQIRSE